MQPQFDQIPEIAQAWLDAGHRVALAHVVQTWGSAPRPAGAMLVMRDDGEMMGSVSGGCVESAVIAEAAGVLETGMPKRLDYGVSDENAFAAGLACGGSIQILLEPVGGAGLPRAMLDRLVTVRAARQSAGLAINLSSYEHRLLVPDAGDPLAPLLRKSLAEDKAKLEGDWYVAPHNPPLRMMVVGAVHIAQPLLEMARLAGFATTLIDPRSAFATLARFPEADIVQDWPDLALRALAPDTRSAVVTLSHDPKIDDPAILAALASPCFYLGCLGSMRTHAKRLSRLGAAHADETALARIHAPVGLAIGAASPAEIAIAIMAQVVARLRQV
ncbi:MAG: XdhC/CoxI family protein [Paracoccaceae bacterium]